MPSTTTDSFERVRYFSRQLITADDMRAEQAYILQKLRRHNRMLHGSGVVCGLDVAAAPTSETPLRIAVSVGYALTPEGDEVCVTKTDYLDLATCGKNTGDPCAPTTTSSILAAAGTNAAAQEDVYLAVRYDECPSRPVRVMPAGCGCGDSSCDYSRTRDGWQLACWPVSAKWLPPSAPATTCSDAISKLISCPTSPADRWVLLARVTFDAGNHISKVDTSVRQWILSTVAIQGVCCASKSAPEPTPAPTGKVTKVDVSPTTVTIKVGEQRQISATVTADPGVATSVTWSSSNSAIVSVSQTGTITGLSRGTATVTATSTADPTKKASVTVTVA